MNRREPSDTDEARKGELSGDSESIEPARGMKISLFNETELDLEAGAGIEPANSGFADRDLTTWLPRQTARADNINVAALVSSAEGERIDACRGDRFCNAPSSIERWTLNVGRWTFAFLNSRSSDLFRIAQTRIPGGVNSPVRAFRGVGGEPFFV